MKFFVDASRYDPAKINTWLIDDLVTELAVLGHEVDVLVHDVHESRTPGLQRESRSGVRTFNVGPSRQAGSRLSVSTSYLRTAFRAHRDLMTFIGSNQYDFGLFFSLGFLSFGVPTRLRRAGAIKHLIFVLWDFFPIHHIEIGRINSRMHAPLKFIEFLAFKRADSVALMSTANELFFQQYHSRYKGATFILPPWGGETQQDGVSVEKRQTFTVVFGGQLTRGRGIGTVIESARELATLDPDIAILVIGSGPLQKEVENAASSEPNLYFTPAMPRAAYLELLQSCHVGLAATVSGVSVPTFPSKIVDYCRTGLPVIVAVECTSDAGVLLSESGAGLSVVAGDVEALTTAIRTLKREFDDVGLNSRSLRSRELFETTFSSQAAALRILTS